MWRLDVFSRAAKRSRTAKLRVIPTTNNPTHSAFLRLPRSPLSRQSESTRFYFYLARTLTRKHGVIAGLRTTHTKEGTKRRGRIEVPNEDPRSSGRCERDEGIEGDVVEERWGMGDQPLRQGVLLLWARAGRASANWRGSAATGIDRDPTFAGRAPSHQPSTGWQRWSKQEAKLNRLKGLAYVGSRRKEKVSANVILHDIIRPPRALGPRCKPDGSCQKWKTRACDKVSEDQRRILFDAFWSETMDWKQRQMFVVTLVDMTNPKQPQKHEVKRVSRSFSYTYHLRVNDKRIPVCQKLFLNTFGLKFSMVGRWLQKYRAIGSADNEASIVPANSSSGAAPSSITAERGNPSPEGPNTANSVRRVRSSVQMRTEHLCRFIDTFPKLPSHYCRSTTEKQYLQTDIRSIGKFYELYKSQCEQDNVTPLSRFVFDQHVKSKNVSIFTPRKDQCDECFQFRMNSLSQEKHDFHIKLKNRAREEKENDKLLAKEKKIHLLCVDVMAVQMLPNIEASIAYYKMKLAIHNYTLYNLENNDVLNCWFTECEASLEASTYNPGGTIDFKIDFDAEFLPLPRRPKKQVVGPFMYPQMSDERRKITKDKYEDLLSLKNHIPAHCHHFYENLPHHDDSIRKAKTQAKNKAKKSKVEAKD
ncbi:hypothetical protein GE061_001874 [Apolygus lucorum]|uniref:Uncharacterized protein n=1 Tax=Apolygus lucorum TaxID=248454 RepID=A0A8S9X3H5_APOLU|nr:hypothetical protein GE061_001874 [Apolygus lucorum]